MSKHAAAPHDDAEGGRGLWLSVSRAARAAAELKTQRMMMMMMKTSSASVLESRILLKPSQSFCVHSPENVSTFSENKVKWTFKASKVMEEKKEFGKKNSFSAAAGLNDKCSIGEVMRSLLFNSTRCHSITTLKGTEGEGEKSTK